MAATGHRRGSETKAEIRDVALELFTAQGYEATSLRQIAERLGITKAALYYHFSGKEDIVRAIFAKHLDDLDALVAWAGAQPRGPELRVRAVDRMVDLMTEDGMQAMRFALANQRVLRELGPGQENVFARLSELFEIVTGPDAPVEEALRLRAALLSANIVLLAAQGLTATDTQIRTVARDVARLLVPAPAPESPGGTVDSRPA